MEDLKKPLLQPGSLDEGYLDNSLNEVPTTEYAQAGFLNKLLFLWLNNVLKKGSQRTLGKDDVPLLIPEYRARKVYKTFTSSWPKLREPHSVRKTLVKTFWSQLLGCSLIAFIRLCVLFVGPLLIQSFVKVTSGEESFAYEGYVLALVLVVCKSVEVTSSHIYQFKCQKVAIQVRAALISSVYRKGLRLSSFARQSHGVGQIVNYMSVDVQQVSDVVVQLNDVWLVPSQLAVALTILFFVSGISAIAGLLVIVVSGIATLITAQKLQAYQRDVTQGRDSRMLVTVESLNNMKIVKLQAWDAMFLKETTDAREWEFSALAKYTYMAAFNTFTVWFTPLACTLAIFACSVLIGEGVTATKAFTAIATVKVVQEPLRRFPQTLIRMTQALISLDRLESYLWSEELQTSAVEKFPVNELDLAINVEGGTFKWGAELEAPNLRDINFRVTPGSMVAVVGKVGSGKTSLLSAVLGEMTKVSGTVRTSGRIAYVAQQSWIQSGTIQDNILFGQPMRKGKYRDVLKQCALQTDLAEMEYGDQTEIGERGINLSGGQKQRIQLARAVYQDCDVYLLDDIFSAVDAHTGSDLFRDCIVGALAGKTVVLVTQQVDLLPGVDLIVVMRNGRIVQSGHYEDLLTQGTDFNALVEASNEALEKVLPHELPDEPNECQVSVSVPVEKSLSRSNSRGRRSPSFSRSSSNAIDMLRLPGSSPTLLPQLASECPMEALLERGFSEREYSSADVKADSNNEGSAQLVQAEQRETGRISWSVYWLYLTRVFGGALLVLLIVIQVFWQMLQIGGDYWVAYGAGEDAQDKAQEHRFIVIYAILACFCGSAVFIRSFLVAYIGLKTAQSFYLGMIRSIFRAPMSFFDTTPTGRVLSRASTDQASTDVQVPLWLGGVLGIGSQLIGSIIVTFAITPMLVFILIPLGYAYYVYQNYYFSTARELTRVDGITKAPVIHHFSETIAGFVTIRSFQQQDRFIQMNVDSIDSNLRMDFHIQAANEWVGDRMELLGVMILCASALLLVALPRGIVNSELVGLCLTYGMNLNGSLFVVSWMYCQLENKMVSVERIGQYTNLPSEAELIIEKTRPSSSWPTTGTIVFKNLKLRYRPQTPLVLKGITLTIKGGDKVGVVGRTGSGKSTLILALFRLVEAAAGCVLIDGIDISTLGLNDLRSRLSIIPQDPTLFDGTVRSNLDILQEHSDTEIWAALERCQLASIVKNIEGKLDAPVLENGENFSLGQRQLFCLGRVLLKRSRILVLDEATASVDAETDSLMQEVIRKEFADSTVLSIAHRIPTVMDSNKVLVLDAGKIMEYDSPATLLENPKSMFSSLVREYSNRSVSYDNLVKEALWLLRWLCCCKNIGICVEGSIEGDIITLKRSCAF